ncbi:unnamed protein product, partial [Symbiodinium sp. KB8]
VGKLPPEFLPMAIGVKRDHIFQGIIYGQPRHPLFMRAIAHAFSKEIMDKIANLDYMIFCKALWRFLRDDMKQEPAVGWNISPTYGTVYLLQEENSAALRIKGDLGNDGHYFVSKQKITVAYTRCWHWQKGFKGDPRAHERRATTMLQGLPQAVAEALDARRVYGQDQEGALPGGELICDDVQASISNNSFEEIMSAIKQERNYAGITAEDVMRCIPRGHTPPSEFRATTTSHAEPRAATTTSAPPPPFHSKSRPRQRRNPSKLTRCLESNIRAPSPFMKWLIRSRAPWKTKRTLFLSATRSSRFASPTPCSPGSTRWLPSLSSTKRPSADRIRILKRPPWIFAPLNLVQTDQGTTWAEAEMHATLETDDNFEIVASTIKAIYDQTCRSCALINRLIIYMPDDGKQVRKMRIDHRLGDTPAKPKLLRPDKRHSETQGPVSEKRQKDETARSRSQWDDSSWWQSSDWTSSSSSWRW